MLDGKFDPEEWNRMLDELYEKFLKEEEARKNSQA